MIPLLDADRFLRECEVLLGASRPEVRRTLKHVYDVMSDALNAGLFDEVNQTLAKANLSVLGGDFALAMLTITLAARSKLPARQEFTRQTIELFAQEGYDEQKIREIMSGLA